MGYRKEQNFISFFNPATGKYLRTGILENGSDTGVDPFMSSFPELLDVGVMGHCIHGRSGLCVEAGVECYQDGLHASRPNMALDDFESIARQCAGKTYQFALGGCGDPDQHENFADILRLCQGYGIVPNFTTSGLGLSKQDAQECKKYCGAVAVSWYRSRYTLNAIRTLLDAGVRTNIHYVLSRRTVREAVERLESNGFPEGINAVVFLLHKPVGLGTREQMIPFGDPYFTELLRIVDGWHGRFRIGFDSCTVPALIQSCPGIDPDSLDTCEGARWSAYISSDMQMMPCSFDSQGLRWAVDLRKHSIKEAWDSPRFELFRDFFRNACQRCAERASCMGGCPICPEIVLCQEREQTDE